MSCRCDAMALIQAVTEYGVSRLLGRICIGQGKPAYWQLATCTVDGDTFVRMLYEHVAEKSPALWLIDVVPAVNTSVTLDAMQPLIVIGNPFGWNTIELLIDTENIVVTIVFAVSGIKS
jgi:hypothetical protein